MTLDDLVFENEINVIIEILKNGECLLEAETSNSNVVKSYAKRMGRPNALEDATVVWRCLEKKYPENWGLINKIFTNWAKKWTAGKVQDIKKSQTKKTKTNRPGKVLSALTESVIKTALYHSTTPKIVKLIKEFGFKYSNPSRSTQYFGHGIYFSKVPDKFYGKDFVKVKVNLKSPFRYDWDNSNHPLGHPESIIGQEVIDVMKKKRLAKSQAITYILKSRGHDGVIGTEHGDQIVVVFDLKNIKVLN